MMKIHEIINEAKEEAEEPLEENTSVNMSPYKEAIQNADTPKKKSVKRKVEDLFNK